MRTKLLLCLFIALVGLNTNLSAQDAADMVYMLNGETKKGKVTAVHEDNIEFIYSGEDLNYDIKKSEIAKITFSSGRTQVFNEQPAAPTAMAAPVSATTAASRKNKLAVLPFVMVSNDQGLMSEAMSGQVQQTAINSFKKNTNQVIVQEAMTTNAILLQNGLDPTSIKTMLPKDVASLLGVEFVVYGTANIEFEGTRTSGLSSTTYKNDKDKDKRKGRELTSNSSTTTTNYDTTIGLTIVSDTGSSLYSVNRNGFGSSLDTYEGTLSYLIKRCPWGTKRK
ncbi:hypothetical protein ACFSYG_09555 [Leeuwenhoekiella polynyae]|uniref:Uncharacterized protein n=1 Tax=Leeuwenhoekiella polynyae TaxID=1550906 RepID=A0A4Q0PGG7_9FLAO|nr:hypothetical protein [Leeuwenhoekiella polynyae]RXG26037.1 hypothetical protein DSM02_28 [Leeuwenhoekiella polynyae]